MCLLCGPQAPAFGEFGITERPAQDLEGLFWEGTHEEAAAGAVRSVLKTVQARSGDLGRSLWGNSIVGVSWNTGPGRFRTFVGFEGGEPESAADEAWTKLALPARKYATVWHSDSDGDVVERYGRMIEWIGMVGHVRPRDGPHHREEYAADVDFDGLPMLRLMLPIA